MTSASLMPGVVRYGVPHLPGWCSSRAVGDHTPLASATRKASIMSTGTTGTPVSAGVIKLITLGTDQYVIAKLDSPVPDGDFDVDVEVTVNPASAPGAAAPAGCSLRVHTGCC